MPNAIATVADALTDWDVLTYPYGDVYYYVAESGDVTYYDVEGRTVGGYTSNAALLENAGTDNWGEGVTWKFEHPGDLEDNDIAAWGLMIDGVAKG